MGKKEVHKSTAGALDPHIQGVRVAADDSGGFALTSGRAAAAPASRGSALTQGGNALAPVEDAAVAEGVPKGDNVRAVGAEAGVGAGAGSQTAARHAVDQDDLKAVLEEKGVELTLLTKPAGVLWFLDSPFPEPACIYFQVTDEKVAKKLPPQPVHTFAGGYTQNDQTWLAIPYELALKTKAA